MAENSVVKEVLTEGMVLTGAELTRKLDEHAWPVVASFWLYLPELNSWKLAIASPVAAAQGPRRAYEQIQMALAALPKREPNVTLSDVEVIEPNHYLVTLLRSVFNTGPTIGGIRFSNNMVNGHFIHDAYIYRVSDRLPGQAA